MLSFVSLKKRFDHSAVTGWHPTDSLGIIQASKFFECFRTLHSPAVIFALPCQRPFLNRKVTVNMPARFVSSLQI